MVVHGGEQLVIRKLVVVGVVSAEKTYIECLRVAKEVSVEENRLLVTIYLLLSVSATLYQQET